MNLGWFKRPLDSHKTKEPCLRVHACFVDALNSNVFLIPMSEKQKKTWIVVAIVIVVDVADFGGHPSTSCSRPKKQPIPAKKIYTTNLNIGNTDS